VADTAGMDVFREHDACGVGFVAQSSGGRSHEVVQMALEAVARVAHRGAASTDNSGDGAGLLTQVPQRLFYRDAYRLGLHLQPGLPFEQPEEPAFRIHFVRVRRARRYVLRVRPDGDLRVTIPRGGSQREALRFADRHLEWARRQRSRVLASRRPAHIEKALREQAKR